MNYEQYIEHEYTYTMPTNMENNTYKVALFMSDGNFYPHDLELDNINVESVCGSVMYLSRQEHSNSTLIAFELIHYTTNNGYNTIYFVSNKSDYIITGENAFIQGMYYEDFVTDELYDFTSPSDYPSYNDMQFTNYSYGMFGVLKNQNTTASKSVYDFTSFYYTDNDSYYLDSYSIRGENISFYKHVVSTGYYNSNPSKYFAYGRPIAKEREAEYQRGYGAGYSAGYTQGNEHGFIIGQNSNNINYETANAFDYIGSAFGAVSNIMSLEVLPHITIGTAFTIPMVFVLIMTIFKLVRK